MSMQKRSGGFGPPLQYCLLVEAIDLDAIETGGESEVESGCGKAREG
jgi:hypothetical protein